MCMTRGCLTSVLEAQPDGEVRLAMPVNTLSVSGQVLAVEGGAYGL
jgi:hypothetical protein